MDCLKSVTAELIVDIWCSSMWIQGGLNLTPNPGSVSWFVCRAVRIFPVNTNSCRISLWKNTHRSRTMCYSTFFHSQITRSHLYCCDITALIRSASLLPSCFLFFPCVTSHHHHHCTLTCSLKL